MFSCHRGAGKFQKQGDNQAQEDRAEAANHPEAPAADQFTGDEQPGQTQQGGKSGHNGGDYPNYGPALRGEDQKQDKNQRINKKNPGHQAVKFPIAISLSHVASLRRTKF